jgi:hypothetical protein
MEAPIDTSDPNNMAGILINNLVKEEDIARQRSPLDLCQVASKVKRILFAGFGTVHLIRPCCPRLLHWSSREQICANYGQEHGLPCVTFWEASDQDKYCK